MSNQKFNHRKIASAITDRYALLTEQANQEIRGSEEYVNYKSPRRDDVQKAADAILAKKAEIDKLQDEVNSLHRNLRESIGLQNRWYDSDDLATYGEYVNNKDRDKTFGPKFKSTWLPDSRVSDLVRKMAEMSEKNRPTVEEVAHMLFRGEDIQLIKEEAKALLTEHDEVDV